MISRVLLASLLTACGAERAVRVEVVLQERAPGALCLTAQHPRTGDAVFQASFEPADANGTLTFVAGEQVDDRLRVTATFRRGGRQVARASVEVAFRSDPVLQVLEPRRCFARGAPFAPASLGVVAGAHSLVVFDEDGDGRDEVLATDGITTWRSDGSVFAMSEVLAAVDGDGDCLEELATRSAGVVSLGERGLGAGVSVAFGDAGRGAGVAIGAPDGVRWGEDGLRVLDGAPVRRVLVADLTGDGVDDLLAIGPAGIAAFVGGPAGPTSISGATPAGWAGTDAALGDLDDDGALDLVLLDGGRLRVARNRGDGLLEAAGEHTVAAERVVVGDMDGDCAADVLIFGAEGASWFRAGERARLEPVGSLDAVHAAFADRDGDGAPELVTLDSGGGIHAGGAL